MAAVTGAASSPFAPNSRTETLTEDAPKVLNIDAEINAKMVKLFDQAKAILGVAGNQVPSQPKQCGFRATIGMS
jgi:phage antirepressor YoqD-like protein